jgi:hypothetical protein
VQVGQEHGGVQAAESGDEVAQVTAGEAAGLDPKDE